MIDKIKLRRELNQLTINVYASKVEEYRATLEKGCTGNRMEEKTMGGIHVTCSAYPKRNALPCNTCSMLGALMEESHAAGVTLTNTRHTRRPVK